jgi:mono/diheme cytochrome c family protein
MRDWHSSAAHFRACASFACALAIGTALVVAQQSDTTRNPLGSSPAAVAAGRAVFDQTCQACHGPGATGDRGPALNTGTFTRGSDDGDLFHAIREGLPGTQMPPFRGLSDEQIWQVVSYLRSLSGIGGDRSAATAPPIRGNRASGETLFFGKAGCATCHQVNGRGAVVGPDLSTIARAPVDAIRQKILNPSAPLCVPAAGGRGGAAGRRCRGTAGRVWCRRRGTAARSAASAQRGHVLAADVDASAHLHLLDKLQLTTCVSRTRR